ncbi:copper chaperone [Spiroplasma gladiatoris]|uniref:Copper chaperone n=1 Tax=Spiroplasma gladiatoris TaxID=2143 RepID=A0A4V1AQE2_9MOLU|nr:heavy-metal-associated domain-containing protein [Spiroplasma gladiatoris]QBQ08189.1 copper chaperone [Spiroplasma gladiatoris]
MEKQIKILVDSLDCASCAITIEKALKNINIISHNVIIPLKEVFINYDTSKTSEEEILNIMKKSGYKGKIIND